MKSSSVKQRQRLLLWIGCIAACIALGIGIFVLVTRQRPLPPAPHASLDQLANVLTSEQFARLPQEQKMPYVQRGLSLSPAEASQMVSLMTPQQRQAAFKNMGGLLIIQSTNDYFQLKTPAQRQAYIDHILDWYDAVRQANNQLPDFKTVSQEQQQEAHVKRHELAGQMLQGLGPSQSARMAEFWKQIILRKAARTISSSFGR